MTDFFVGVGQFQLVEIFCAYLVHSQNSTFLADAAKLLTKMIGSYHSSLKTSISGIEKVMLHIIVDNKKLRHLF